MYELSIQGHISSAHFLAGYEGKCKTLHGHNWRVEVVVQGTRLNDIGMVADFGVLKEHLNHLLSGLDHLCLNDLSYFKETNPTTENIARYIYESYSGMVAPLQVAFVRVWESDTAHVTYRDD